MKRSLSIPARLSELCTVREAVQDFIGPDLGENEAGRVILAIDEAVSNIIIHGYKCDENQKVDIDMESGPDSFTFVISDTAPEYNPLSSAPPDIGTYHENGLSSGLGVDVYRRVMKVQYIRDTEGGNRLILVKEKKHENR